MSRWAALLLYWLLAAPVSAQGVTDSAAEVEADPTGPAAAVESDVVVESDTEPSTETPATVAARTSDVGVGDEDEAPEMLPDPEPEPGDEALIIGPDATPDEYGWPPNASSLRGLPQCEAGAPIPQYGSGEQFTCHPPFPEEHGLNFALLMGVPFGASFLGSSEMTRAGGWDFEAEFYANRAFGFAAGYRFAASAPLGADRDGDGLIDEGPERTSVHAFSGGLRFRWLTDEPTRRAWILGVDGAYGLSARPESSLIRSGPLLQLGVSRQVGSLNGPRSGFLARLGVRYDQGLLSSTRSYRALFLTGRIGFERAFAPPRDFALARRGPRVPLAVTVTLPVGEPIGRPTVGIVTGVRLSVGPALWRGIFEPRVRAGFERLARPVTNAPLPDDGRVGVARRFLVGGGVRVRPIRYLTLDLSGGYRIAVTDLPARDFDGAFVEGGAGFAYAACGLGAGLGLYYRWHHYEETEPIAPHELGLAVDFSFGTSGRTFGGDCETPPGSNPRIETLVRPRASGDLPAHGEGETPPE